MSISFNSSDSFRLASILGIVIVNVTKIGNRLDPRNKYQVPKTSGEISKRKRKKPSTQSLIFWLLFCRCVTDFLNLMMDCIGFCRFLALAFAFSGSSRGDRYNLNWSETKIAWFFSLTCSRWSKSYLSFNLLTHKYY